MQKKTILANMSVIVLALTIMAGLAVVFSITKELLPFSLCLWKCADAMQ